MTCSLCGYSMQPLETVCRKCKGQGIAAPPVPELREDFGYKRPDYVPAAPPKREFPLNLNVILGGAACLFGLVATVVGYFNAAPGGTYPIFWGAMLFGGIRFVNGLTGDD